MSDFYKINLFPNYNKDNIILFENLEKYLTRKITLNNCNNILMIIFTTFCKLYYSDDNNHSTHMHVALDSILIFIFSRLLNLPNKYLKKFLIQNKYITKDFLKENINEKFKEHISVEMSANVVDKYKLYNIRSKIGSNDTEYYNITCNSEHVINFKCSSQGIMMGTFKSYENDIYRNIPYIFVLNPIVYGPQYFNNQLKIWIISLENENCLMLVEWSDSEAFHPIDNIFELLLTNNLSNMINNSKQNPKIQVLLMPMLNNINSTFSNVHRVLEHIDQFNNLFIDKYESKNKCKNFQFINVSKLKVNINTCKHMQKYVDHFPKTLYNISIMKPFLYLLFNKNLIFQSGGFFDCDSIINEFNNEKVRMKYQRF